MIISSKGTNVFFSAALTAATLSLLGCSAESGDPSEASSVADVQSGILNGDAVANAGVNVFISSATGVCSSTALTNQWLITAKHCQTTTASTLTRGVDVRGVAQVIDHPTLDVTLVQAVSAFPSVYTTSMYPWDPSRLVNQPVTCYGYGRPTLGGSSGTLRSGALKVSAASSSELTLVSADSRNQMAYLGDSGGGCFLEHTSRALVGVSSYGTVTVDSNGNPTGVVDAVYIPTSAFSRWAIPIIAGSTQRLACLGRECLTNPNPLPNSVSQQVAWRPCPDQLSGPGTYYFDFEATYNFSDSYDNLLLNGQTRTGVGTVSGTSIASHLGNQIGIYTNGSIQSPGVSWLRAKCPNDP